MKIYFTTLIFGFLLSFHGNLIGSNWSERFELNIEETKLSDDDKLNLVASAYVDTVRGVIDASRYLYFFRENIYRFVDLSRSPFATDSAVSTEVRDQLLVSTICKLDYILARTGGSPYITEVLDRSISTFRFNGQSLDDFMQELNGASGGILIIYISEYERRRFTRVSLPKEYKDKSPRQILIMIAAFLDIEAVFFPNGTVVLTRFVVPHNYRNRVDNNSSKGIEVYFNEK